LCAGVIPFFFVTKVKGWLGYDDALDTFGVHAVGGTMGALLTGFLATDKVNGNLSYIADAASANPATKNGLAKLVANGGLWIEQLKAIGVTLAMAIVGTVVIAYIVKATVGLRASEEVETIGLDLAEHGEEGYHGQH
jgi:Amt family ammonium transporter